MMSWGNIFKIIVAAVIMYVTWGAAAPYLAAGATASSIATGMAIMAAGGFAAGVITTGTLKGGLYGAFGAMLTAGISAMNLGPVQGVFAQGVSGGIMESLQGGDFGHGFIAAGLTAAVMPQLGKISNDVGRTIVGALVGGTLSEVTGGKFANGAISGAVQAAMMSSPEVGKTDGDIIYPAGESTDINDYCRLKVPGILAGDRDYYQALADQYKIPYFYNESEDFLADFSQSFRQKFFPRTDRLAGRLSAALSGVDHPMRIIADSQGTIIVRNAAQYFGLPHGSSLEMWSPAVSRASALSAANMIGGSLIYRQPRWDGANLWAPSASPLQFMSGARDLFCMFCVHRANARAFEVSP